MRRLTLLILCLLMLDLRAHGLDATRPVPVVLGLGVADLADGWRVQKGDDPAWAQTAFDDSAWPLTILGSGNSAATEPGWRWYRKHVDLPVGHPPLELMVAGPVNAFQVYVNGVLAKGPEIRSMWHLYAVGERVIPVSEGGGQDEIAIRVHLRAPDAQIYGLAISRVLLGPVAAIEQQQRLAIEDRLVGFLPSASGDLMQILAGLAAILLFLMRRTSREYLYLGLYLALGGISMFTFYGVMAGFAPDMFNNFLGDPLGYPELILQIEFTYAFMGRKVGRGWRVFEWAMVGCLLGVVLMNLHILPPPAYLLMEGASNLPIAVVLPVLLFAWYLRGNSEAGWLVAPSIVVAAANVVADLGLVARQLGWSQLAFMSLPVAIGPVTLSWQDIASFVYLLAIGVVMTLRFTRVSREQARSAAELGAAREIQQRLVPVVLPVVAGCRIEAAYLPANEVGGDFYQVMEQDDGATLIVVGDVSGKGLKAAMTGTLAIGALRTLISEGLGPAELLRRLNREMVRAENGGFITCVCVRISRDRVVVIANAGHLAPYRNGEEVEVESGLPLGILAGAEYGETILKLNHGDLLTLLSDGVVEAQKPDGELFGFERTREISGQSADAIAAAAQAFGQEDDITVLTLAFSG